MRSISKRSSSGSYVINCGMHFRKILSKKFQNNLCRNCGRNQKGNSFSDIQRYSCRNTTQISWKIPKGIFEKPKKSLEINPNTLRKFWINCLCSFWRNNWRNILKKSLEGSPEKSLVDYPIEFLEESQRKFLTECWEEILKESLEKSLDTPLNESMRQYQEELLEQYPQKHLDTPLKEFLWKFLKILQEYQQKYCTQVAMAVNHLYTYFWNNLYRSECFMPRTGKLI